MEIKDLSREDLIKHGFLYIPPKDAELPLSQEIEVGYKFNTALRVIRFGKWVNFKEWPNHTFIRAYKRRKK